MFDALKAALGLATSNGDLQKYLYDMGYELDIKKARMKSRFTKKWVSLKILSDTFGEDCMPSDFEFFYEKNEMDYEEGRLGSFEPSSRCVMPSSGVCLLDALLYFK